MPAVAAKEKPILFSSAMVRAILSGRKTQTRRVVSSGTSSVSCRWDRLEFDESRVPRAAAMGILPDYYQGAYLHVPVRPHPDDPQDDASYWTRIRVYPRWEIGMRLWVRESFDWVAGTETRFIAVDGEKRRIEFARYKADGCDPISGKWTPSIHMPRWLSRITLEITDVRVERVRDISLGDAIAEGIERKLTEQHLNDCSSIEQACFATLWDSINAKRGFGWDANPWVWVIEFKKL